MSPKLTLTDRKLKSLKPATERYEIRDSVVPGLSVRVGSKGRRVFVLNARFGGSPNPARRTIGVYGAISLEQAREKAREWLELIRKGIDPRVAEERARQAELRKQGETFGTVAEAYIQHIAHHRTSHEAAGTIRRECRQWWHRPVSEISRRDVITLVQSIAKRAPYQGHLTFGHVRAIFNWAIAQDAFGLEFSPTDRIKPKDIIAPKQPRQRVLSDKELVALWNATEKLGGPFAALYRLLLLTGCRRSELAEAKWSEIDLAKGIFVVPAERFKSGVSHLVPLSTEAVSILRTLPRHTGGDFVFSNSLGKQPVGNFSATKRIVDELMVDELAGADVTPWKVHDLRRTLRTRLASLQVPDVVAEAIVGHGRKGLQRVYDQHSYEPEMRAALERWALRLRSIISPLSTTILNFPSIA
jgi:integrase